MTDAHFLHEALGRPGEDPGCAACFDVMDEAAEALAAGEEIARRFGHVAAHVHACAACREDLEGLRTYLGAPSAGPQPPHRRAPDRARMTPDDGDCG